MQAKGEEYPCYLPNDDTQIINLEHVLPRNPEDNWPQFQPEEAQLWYRRVGNLALLQANANADLQTASFEDKRAVLKQSPYELTNMIGRANRWTAEEITSRQRQMAELAVEAWPLQ